MTFARNMTCFLRYTNLPLGGGCWFCPNARYVELKHPWTHHPDLWNKLLELENEPDLIGNMWNTLTKTRIHDWEERFYWEERQMNIFDYLKED